MAATAASVGLATITAAFGRSAAVIPLPAGGFPFGRTALATPSPWLVTGLLATAVLATAAACLLAWRALDVGWTPSPARLLAGGLLAVAVLVVVPPVAGADVLNYAAYGHMATHGRDPYTTRPDTLPGDPFAKAVEPPWRGTPSVYGPLATEEEALAVSLAGDALRPSVGILDLLGGLAFGVAAVVLFFLAGPTDDRRRRAVLAFGLNPVLLFVVVAAGHVDAVAALAIVAGLALHRRSPMLAGVAGGAAVLVKLTAGLPLAGWAWIDRQAPTRLARLAGGAVLVAGGGYALVGLHALNQARRASSFVSVATPWRPVRSALELVVPNGVATWIVSAGSLALALVLVLRLAQDLPEGAVSDTLTGAARAGLIVALAWALATPYALAWYDAVPWALIALLPLSRHRTLLLAHTGMLALAYLPGRDVALPPALSSITSVLRSGVAPVVLAAVIVGVLVPGTRLQAGSLRRRPPS